MKKHLKLIRNENGQMLLFVLISSAIIITIFIGAVKLYMISIEESQFLLEQLEVETIVQMSQVDLLRKEKKDNKELKSYYNYIYPNGDIHLKLTKLDDGRYLIKNNITLMNKSEYESSFNISRE